LVKHLGTRELDQLQINYACLVSRTINYKL
jgi:hypothetical protein